VGGRAAATSARPDENGQQTRSGNARLLALNHGFSRAIVPIVRDVLIRRAEFRACANGKKTIPWVAGFPRRAMLERFADA